MFNLRCILFCLTILLTASISSAQKVAVVDVQKVFDGYQKVKSARERLDKSKKKLQWKNLKFLELKWKKL